MPVMRSLYIAASSSGVTQILPLASVTDSPKTCSTLLFTSLALLRAWRGASPIDTTASSTLQTRQTNVANPMTFS